MRGKSRIDGELRSTRGRIDAPSSSLPHTGEVENVKKWMDRLCSDFGEMAGGLNDRVDAIRARPACGPYRRIP